MSILAIKGHVTRYKEVIELLEMLGGENKEGHNGNNPNVAYYISHKKIIKCDYVPNIYPSLYKCIDYTLEEFLEKFPYKIGDKVLITDDTNDVYIIKSMIWNTLTEGVAYRIETINGIEDNCTWYADEMVHYKKQKEETIEENLTIQDIRDNNAEWLLNKLQEMSSESALQTISDLYDDLHKPRYPKTYEECCKVLGIDPNNYLSIRNLYQDDGEEETTDYESVLLEKFDPLWELIICRDTYWKIAGEQMGLGRPWKPDWSNYDNIKYIIGGYDNEIGYDQNHHIHKILAFPTEKMRVAFNENFKDLIESCRELL
jgi:hypothetical protein